MSHLISVQKTVNSKGFKSSVSGIDREQNPISQGHVHDGPKRGQLKLCPRKAGWSGGWWGGRKPALQPCSSPSAAPHEVDRPTPKAWPCLLNEPVDVKLQTRETKEAPVAGEGLRG